MPEPIPHHAPDFLSLNSSAADLIATAEELEEECRFLLLCDPQDGRIPVLEQRAQTFRDMAERKNTANA